MWRRQLFAQVKFRRLEILLDIDANPSALLSCSASSTARRQPLGEARRLMASTGGTGDWEFNDAEKPRGPRAHRTHTGRRLPEGWQEHRSPARGIYYGHGKTGVVQWDFPTGPPTQAQIDAHFKQQYGDQIAKLQPGKAVVLQGLLSAPHLNGKSGTCEAWDFSTGKIRVRMSTGELKAVKPQFVVAKDTMDFKAENQQWFEKQKTANRPNPETRPLSDEFTQHPWINFRMVGKAVGGALLVYGVYTLWCRAFQQPPDPSDIYFDPVANRWRERRTGRIVYGKRTVPVQDVGPPSVTATSVVSAHEAPQVDSLSQRASANVGTGDVQAASAVVVEGPCTFDGQSPPVPAKAEST